MTNNKRVSRWRSLWDRVKNSQTLRQLVRLVIYLMVRRLIFRFLSWLLRNSDALPFYFLFYPFGVQGGEIAADLYNSHHPC